MKLNDPDVGTWKAVLAFARSSIRAALAHEDLPAPPSLTWPEAGGVFVTLKTRRGRLRGCIGYTQLPWPTPLAVQKAAIAAAVADVRFPRVGLDELEELVIKVAFLSPLEPVDDPETITVGRDGLVVELGSARGLLLPEVAVEYGWDRRTFLAQTCLKAGLPPETAVEKLKIYRFTTVARAEDEL